MNDGEKGQDNLCAWIHRPPSNSQVCITARVKGEKKKKTTERKEMMTYCMYEKKEKKSRGDTPFLMGLVAKIKKLGQRG